MNDDLVKRLRHGIGDAVRDHALMQEAADHIEALEARARDVEAERDVLREALRRLLFCPGISSGNHADPEWGCSETYAAEINARAALNREADT